MKFLAIFLFSCAILAQESSSIFLEGQHFTASPFIGKLEIEKVNRWIYDLDRLRYKPIEETDWEALKQEKIGAYLKDFQVELIGDYRIPCKLIENAHNSVAILSKELEQLKDEVFKLVQNQRNFSIPSKVKEIENKITTMNNLIDVIKNSYHESFFNYDRKVTYSYNFKIQTDALDEEEIKELIPEKIKTVHSYQMGNEANPAFENVLEHIYGLRQESVKSLKHFEFRLIRQMRAIDFCLADTSIKMKTTMSFARMKKVNPRPCFVIEPKCPNGEPFRGNSCLYYNDPRPYPNIPNFPFEPPKWPHGPDVDPPKPSFHKTKSTIGECSDLTKEYWEQEVEF